MDIIADAMVQKLHLCKDDWLREQTWEIFRKQSKGKRLFIFGAGGGLDYFLRNCCDHIKIEGVVDNDEKKRHLKLGWSSIEAWNTEYEEIIIDSPNVLRQYKEHDIVVLITAVNGYELMVEQLRRLGIMKPFVLLMMEANRRGRSEISLEKDYEERKREYIEWCCGQKLQENKIVMRIAEYGGHARGITPQLLKSGKKLDIVWLVQTPHMEVPQGVRKINEKNWKAYYYEMETAKIWLFDVTIPEDVMKRKNQIYIQTKHWSGITLKKFYLEDRSSCTSPQIEARIRKDGMRMDYLLSGSEFDEESCRRGLAFRGRAVRVGSPRSDILFGHSVRKKVLSVFCLEEDTHILLYAPTYRKDDHENGNRMRLSLDLDKLLETLKKKWEGKWVVLIRLHPWISFEKSGLQETGTVINAGNYPDSEELVAGCDVMITDYSSIMFEGAYIKKPVFLYTPDRNEYIEGERGLLLDYDTLPFPMAESNEELSYCIQNFEKKQYEETVKKFLKKYGVNEDGHASERAAAFILDLLSVKDI